MVMGVQRSGTNALFRALSAGSSVQAFNERADGPWYEQFFLRPESMLRPLLASTEQPILLKPISETKRRSVADVLVEFESHQPRLVWVYRDPVNCFYSHTQRWSGFVDDPTGFAAHWCHRNAFLLDALDEHGDQIAVVRYRELHADPQVFRSLQGFLGTEGRYRFRADRAEGRKRVSTTDQAVIDGACASIFERLNQARTCPGRSLSVPARWAERWRVQSAKNQQTPL